MWATALVYHPESKYANLDEESRVKEILEDLELTITWADYTDLHDHFKRLCLSKAQRFLISWESKLEERNQFIDSLPYSADTYEILDKMMASTDKMWKQYMTCLKDVENEKATQSKGGAQESLLEKGIL